MTTENPENLNILENPLHKNPEPLIEEEVLENKEKKTSWKEKTSETIKNLTDKISKSFSKKPEEEKEPLSEEEMVSEKATQIGFNLEEFEANEDWKNLSNGQKMLALEQMSQNTLLNVKQMGEERFAQKLKESSFFGKIGKNLRKSYFISKEEKQVLEEVRKGEVKPKQESAEVIIKHLKELDLETTIDSDSGKAIIEFAKTPDNCPEELWEKLFTYNKIANDFSKIPARFSNENLASKSESKKFKDLQKKFKEAQKALIKEQSKFDSEFTVLDNTADQEFKVRALQSKIEHPDAFKALDAIKGELSLGRFANNENSLRVLYSTIGFGLRKSAAGALGIAAAPAVAGVIGIFRGLRNADKKIKDAYIEGQSTLTRKEKIEELKNLKKQAKEENGKWGGIDYSPEKIAFIAGQINELEGKKSFGGKLKNILLGEKKKGTDVAAFVNVDDLNDRLDRLKDKFHEYENSGNNIKKAEKYFELVRRIDFINKKYQEGLINFGTKQPASEKYELLKKIAELQTFTDPYKTLDGVKYRLQKDGSIKEVLLSVETDDVKNKLKKFDKDFVNNKFQNKQVRIMSEEVVRGVANAVLFSSLAVGIREWYQGAVTQEFASDTFKAQMSGDKTTNLKIEDVEEKNLNLQKALKNISDEQSGINSEENQGKFQEALKEEITKEPQKTDAVKESLISSLALVKKGDGVTNPLARQIEEMLKNPEQAKSLGFDGKNPHKFALKKAAELAKEYGYIKQDGSEVRLETNAIGHASYEVKMIDGKLAVNESFNGVEMTEGNIDKEYEYSYKKEPKVSTPSEEEIVKVPTNKSNIKPDFKFLQDKNNPEWIEANKPTVDGETKLAQDIIKDKNNHLGQELQKYHDYVKAETGKDIAVKSDDTPETYKKALDEALKSSGKNIPIESVSEEIKVPTQKPIETTVEATKIEEVNIPKKELEKPLDDIKSEINKSEHIEKVLSGTEKTEYLNQLQKNTLDRLNSNLEDLKKVPSASKKIEELMTPSDSNHTRIVLEGSSKDLTIARNSIDNYYKDNAINLEGDSKKINVTLIEDNGNKLVRTALETSVSEPKIIEEFTMRDSDGTYHTFRVIEIQKIKKFE